MRIGFDAREGFRPEPRGIGLYVRHLMREFDAARPDALDPRLEFLLYHQLPRPAHGLDVPANMRPVQCDLPGGRVHSWERVQIPWRIRCDKVDVYHGTYNTLPPRWRLWPGPPMVVSLHDVIVTWWPDDLGDPFVRYARAVTPRVVRDAALVLTVSEWSRRDICERFGADPQKVRLSLNGLHPEFLRGAPAGAGDAARARWAEGRPYLYSPGAPLERKNTGRLLEAFGRLRQRRKDLPHLLLISGLGRAQARFAERAAAAGCLDHVRFVPYVERSELIALYAGADLAVYPSLVEGWGIPVTEALALGTPVATSNTSAMPEAGGDHAFYFDPATAEGIAHGLEQALDRLPEFAAVRDAAIARARTFTWRRTAEGVLAAYREVAG
ncbi:MAG: glycosyltransferase family 4 protein [Planctomycetota bacterium]